FTVVATIFLPLTLIVGWYGMNFTNMPELSSPYGYPAIILISLLLCLFLILLFKRKKWF
ncbi:MAG: CorA family divalent cation transporter, partial [Anaerovoracaceae bacterium]